MRRSFLTVITISQLFGALFAFSYFDETLKQTPLSTLGTMQQVATLGTLAIYLLGLVGSILVWLSRRAGLWLSLVHQILIIPVFFIPGVFYWVIGDGLAVAAVVWQTGTATSFTVAFNFGSNSLVSALGATDGASYYGVNIFALICAVYLNRLLRAGLFE